MQAAIKHSQGATFDYIVPILDEDGDPFDLTGCTVRAEALEFNECRPGTALRLDLGATIYSDVSGLVRLQQSAATALGWRDGNYEFDIRVTLASAAIAYTTPKAVMTVVSTITRSAP